MQRSGLAWTDAAGLPDEAATAIAGAVYDILPDGAGGWYLAGRFQVMAGESTVNSLAHLRNDGTFDPEFSFSFSFSNPGQIHRLVRYDDRLYLAGTFSTVDGLQRRGLAAIDLTTKVVVDWNPDPDGGVVELLAADGLLYAAGSFDRIGGKFRQSLARLDPATGVADAWTWGTGATGRIETLLRSDDRLYLGGDFQRLARYHPSLMQVDAAGEPVADFAAANGPILAIVDDGAGGWFVGGSFSRIGSSDKRNLAHILPDGSVDAAWTADTDGVVHALAREGAALYLGGAFAEVAGQDRLRLAQVAVADGGLQGWNAGANGTVRCLAVDATRVFAGGDFTSAGGASRAYLVAIERSSGAATAWQPAPSNPVHSLLVDGDELYVGGDFTTIAGEGRNRLAVFDIQAAPVPGAFIAHANGTVADLAKVGEVLYCAGAFTSFGGASRGRAAAFDLAVGGGLLPWDPACDGVVDDLAVAGDRVVLGGAFGQAGGQARAYLAAVAAAGAIDAGQATAWKPVVDARVNAVHIAGTGVVAGGAFRFFDARERQCLASIDLSGTPAVTDWQQSFSRTSSHGSPVVYDLITDGAGTIYAAGVFDQVGGLPRRGVVGLDATSAAVTGLIAGLDGAANCLAYADGLLYIGGAFEAAGGAQRRNAAAITVASNTATAWDPRPVLGGSTSPRPGVTHRQPLTSILPLTGSSSVVLVGAFDWLRHHARSGAMAIDATSGTVLDFDPQVRGRVNDIALAGAETILVGDFYFVGAMARRNAAKVATASGDLVAAWDLGIEVGIKSDALHSVEVAGDRVLLGGDFQSVGGQPYENLAEVDLTTGTVRNGWFPRPKRNTKGATVYGTRVVGDEVLVYGAFDMLGGGPRSNLAAIDIDTGLALDWSPRLAGTGSHQNLGVHALIEHDNQLTIGGSFYRIEGQDRQNLARLDLVSGTVQEWNPQAIDVVRCLAHDGDGLLYVGGDFTGVGGLTRNHLAAIDTQTGIASAWDPAVDGVVESLLWTADQLYVGGAFDQIGGVARSHLAAVRLDTAAVTDWQPQVDEPVRAMQLTAEQLFIGGERLLTAIDRTDASVAAWQPTVSGTIQTMVLSDESAIVGGSFSRVADIEHRRLAGVDRQTGLPATSWPSFNNGSIEILTQAGDLLLVGGGFSAIDGRIEHRGFARIPLLGPPDPGDADGDGTVGEADLQLVSDHFGKDLSSQGWEPRADLNQDGVVNREDLALVIQYFGTTY